MGSIANAEPTVDMSTAVLPNNIDAVPSLLKEINAAVGSLSTGGDEARHGLLLKARSLIQALETPRETMIKHCWGQPMSSNALAYGVDIGLWTLMAKTGNRPQKVSELAAALNVEPALLSRLMRHVAAMGYIVETGEDEYIPTNFVNSLSIPVIGDGYLAIFGPLIAGMTGFFKYARKYGNKVPTDAKHTPLMHASDTDKDMFAYVQEAGFGVEFNHHMGGYCQGRPPWMAPNFYPVAERLIDGADKSPDAAFLVDIGGGFGHDLATFHKYHPTAPGKLIVEDLPVVIDQIKELDPAITRLPYDFHTEQPIKGARAYYMHSVLHDWPDEVCKSILDNIKAAMKPGYSRLLINENVVPPVKAYWEMTALDNIMMTLFSSRERTQADWYHLLEGIAGLKITRIWTGGQGVESLIEVELPSQ